MHLIQHLSHHLCKQTTFTPQLWLSIHKGKLFRRKSKPAYWVIGHMMLSVSVCFVTFLYQFISQNFLYLEILTVSVIKFELNKSE